MPTYYARANGNINDAIWATTPTGTASNLFPSFTNQDTLVLNGFTSIVINVSFTVGEVRADTTGGATAGGGLFYGSNGLTVTANLNHTGGTVNGMITTSALANNLTIVGTITGGTTPSVRWMATNGTVNIVGNIVGGTGGNAFLYDGGGSGVVNITGNVTGGTAANAFGVGASASGAVINITGNVTGGSNSSALGVNHSTSNTINVIGSVTAAAASGISTTSTGTTTVAGTVTGATAAGIAVSGTGTVTVARAKGGPLATSAVGVSNGTAGSIVNVSEIEYGDLGASPTSGPVRLTDATTNVAVMYRVGLSKKTLVDTASTALLPAASNVRSGITYNAGQTTGTCAVPGAASVLVGVPVDNTVGTASVSSAAIQSACDAALAAFSSGRLANAATVATVGQQLANALTPS